MQQLHEYFYVEVSFTPVCIAPHLCIMIWYSTIILQKVLLALQGWPKPRTESEWQVGGARWEPTLKTLVRWHVPCWSTPRAVSTGTPTLPPQVVSSLFLRNKVVPLRRVIKQLFTPVFESSFLCHEHGETSWSRARVACVWKSGWDAATRQASSWVQQ